MINIIEVSDVVGLIGVAITLLAYFLLNIHKIKASSFMYPFLNALGSLMILFSIHYAWNIAAWVMEVCWLLVSLYGVFGYFLRQRKKG